jgi:epoxyqueuosine reductase
MGNRVFGCDDCQLTCPWNRYAKQACEPDFEPRHGLDEADLLDLFSWSEEEFLKNTEGSAIRRTGYEGWLRNLAIGLGNIDSKESVTGETASSRRVVAALQSRIGYSTLVDHHIAWAISQHQGVISSS